MMLTEHQRKASVQWLAKEYHDLNGTQIEVLTRPPSALEFARLVHISRPVVIRGRPIIPPQDWSTDNLVRMLGHTEISIAVTPNGRADAITQGSDGKSYFTEPCVEKMTVAVFLEKLHTDVQGDADLEIFYLQSQNGNVYSAYRRDPEFEVLQPNIPRDISWCSEALGAPPDAVNLWIGDSRSVTSIHSDPYENIYTVVEGKKHFTLLPPCDGWALEERLYPHAAYTRAPNTAALTVTPSPSGVPFVRWSSVVDPHMAGAFPPEVHPLSVILSAGDTLYLPAGWWHHVRQSGSMTIALNWWYDMEMRGMAWTLLSFFRGVRVPYGNEGDQEVAPDSDVDEESTLQ